MTRMKMVVITILITDPSSYDLFLHIGWDTSDLQPMTSPNPHALLDNYRAALLRFKIPNL